MLASTLLCRFSDVVRQGFDLIALEVIVDVLFFKVPRVCDPR